VACIYVGTDSMCHGLYVLCGIHCIIILRDTVVSCMPCQIMIHSISHRSILHHVILYSCHLKWHEIMISGYVVSCVIRWVVSDWHHFVIILSLYQHAALRFRVSLVQRYEIMISRTAIPDHNLAGQTRRSLPCIETEQLQRRDKVVPCLLHLRHDN